MNALAERIAQDYAAAAATRAAPVPARARAAIARLTGLGLPGTRDENWKYAQLRGLERLRFSPPVPAAATEALALPAPIEGFERYVFVDGRFASALSAGVHAPFRPLSAAAAGAPEPMREPGADERFALLNEAFATDGAQLAVPAGAAARVELLFVAQAQGSTGASYPRCEFTLEADARLELIERHLSAAAQGSFVNSALEIRLARGAQLTHYRLQELSGSSTLFDTLHATLQAGAAYQLHAVSTGAAAARSTQTVRLAGEQAQVAMAIAALGDAQQVQDTLAVVEHVAPRTRTAQLFRGIAAGRSRVAFNGRIVVGQGAAGADSQQSLRGLLAGPTAEIDARPQLEIYTDEVRCSHGASVGKLDQEMLFYLLSRGLEPDTAQRLLKWAFLADALARIQVPQLRRHIEENLAQVLRDTALQELL